ncbi:MAG: aromatic ring-hydroxylating dioxygenase subunit alpha [Acidobacteriales bacterium]|nr:aromatic ring-hydroxylating dioxygenase subunit alpha [Terriglobales bacterium]
MISEVQSPAQTLPGRYYTDPELFKAEVERFYCRTWVCAGRAGQIPNAGDYFLREVAGESILITRTNTGAIKAYFNVCRHRGTRICATAEGAFPGRIQCPYHGWTYSLEGKLIGAPHMDHICREDYPLNPVQADTWDGHIFINLNSDGQSLREQLADLPDRFTNWHMGDLRLYKRMVYEVKANWKLLILNYNECLHCPVLHPTLNKLTSYTGAENVAPHPAYIGGQMGFKDGARTMSMDGKLRRDYLPSLTEEEREKVCYYAIYPNLLLSLHPDYMMTYTLWPEAVNRTQVICEWHFHPDQLAQPGFYAEDAVDFWDLTNKEDWSISELSQLGISSRAYKPGPYSSRESLLHAFDETVLEREKQSK